MVAKPMLGQVGANAGNVGEPSGSRGASASVLDSERVAAPVAGTRPGHLLSHTVETEVVPRLLLIHRGPPSAEEARVPPVGADDVAGLVAALLADQGAKADGIIEAVRARGATLEQVSLDLMATAARRMGEMWVDDECTYTDVTLGVWRMQGLLRALSPVFEARCDHVRGGGRRALIAVAPGENHAFGTDMVSGFLRLSGWEVSNEPTISADALADRVRRDPATVIGISFGCSDDLQALAGLVTLVRRAAGRPVGIMVGGHIVTKSPTLALRTGADAIALDARHSVRQAEGLLQLLGLVH